MSKHLAPKKQGYRPVLATMAVAAVLLSSAAVGSAAFADEPVSGEETIEVTPTEPTPTPTPTMEPTPTPSEETPAPVEESPAPVEPGTPAEPEAPVEETPTVPEAPADEEEHTSPETPTDEAPVAFAFVSVPTISGPLVVGSTLHLSPVDLTVPADKITYQWVTTAEHWDDELAMVGATGTSLYLTSDLHDRSLAVRITAVKGDQTITTMTEYTNYLATEVPEETPRLTNISPAYLTGTTTVGTTITANPGVWSHPNTLFTYEWFVNFGQSATKLDSTTSTVVVPESARSGRIGVIVTANLGFQHAETRLLSDVIPGGGTVTPTIPAAPFPTDAGLDDANKGGITGGTVGVQAYMLVLNGVVGQIVYVYGYSTPTFLGAYTLDANKEILVDYSALPAGDHRLAVVDADGALLGWYGVTVPAITVGIPGSPAAITPVNAAAAANSAIADELGYTGAGKDTGMMSGIAVLMLLAGLIVVVFTRKRKTNAVA